MFKTLLCQPTLFQLYVRGAGGARAPPEFGGSEKGRSLISAYRSLDITTNTPGFKKLSTALKLILFFTHSSIEKGCKKQQQLSNKDSSKLGKL